MTMEISSDELRRQVKQSQAEHKRSLRSMKEVYGRLLEGRHGESPAAVADFLSNGIHRRRFLQIGGITILSSAMLAACGKTTSSTRATPVSEPPTSAPARPDVGILRLASSLEHYAVGLYMTAAGSGLVKTTAIADAAK